MKGVETYPERQRWPALGGKIIPLLGYADDIAMISRDMVTLRARMLRLEEICRRAGFDLSTKTKLLAFNMFAEMTPGGMQLRDLTIEPVPTFTYLGSEVNADLDIGATISDRLTKARTVFAMLRRIWEEHLPMKLKSLLYNSLVRPVALYGAETWTTLPAHENQIDAFDMECLRRLTHISLLQHLTNQEVRSRAQCPVALSEVCRQYRLRYYGHLCRLPHRRLPKHALWYDAPGQRRPGHPALTWLDLITKDATTRGYTRSDLLALSHDQDRYREEVVYGDRVDGATTRTRPKMA